MSHCSYHALLLIFTGDDSGEMYLKNITATQNIQHRFILRNNILTVMMVKTYLLGDGLGYQLRSQLGDGLGYQLRSQLGDGLGYQLRSQLGDGLGYQLRSQLGDGLGYQLAFSLKIFEKFI